MATVTSDEIPYFSALLSVLMRQTNIVWVGMFLGYTCMDKLVSQTLPFIKGMEKRSAYTFHVKKKTIKFRLKFRNVIAYWFSIF